MNLSDSSDNLPGSVPRLTAFSCVDASRTKRVLVVDDDDGTRRLIALLLTRAGYAVDMAADGQTALDALGTGKYKMLVTDNDMPRLTGLQLIERLRLKGVQIPIVVVSGSLSLGRAGDYSDLHLTAVLQKPFAFRELIDIAIRTIPATSEATESGDEKNPQALEVLPDAVTGPLRWPVPPSGHAAPRNRPTGNDSNLFDQ